MYTLFDEITLRFVTWWEIGHEVNLTFGQFSSDFQDVELFMYNYNHFLRKSLRLGPERQEVENEWSRVWVRSSLQQSRIWRGNRGVQGCAGRNVCSNVAFSNSRPLAEAVPILGTELNLHALSLTVVMECAAHLLLILEVLA